MTSNLYIACDNIGHCLYHHYNNTYSNVHMSCSMLLLLLLQLQRSRRLFVRRGSTQRRRLTARCGRAWPCRAPRTTTSEPIDAEGLLFLTLIWRRQRRPRSGPSWDQVAVTADSDASAAEQSDRGCAEPRADRQAWASAAEASPAPGTAVQDRTCRAVTRTETQDEQISKSSPTRSAQPAGSMPSWHRIDHTPLHGSPVRGRFAARGFRPRCQHQGEGAEGDCRHASRSRLLQRQSLG